MVVTCNSSCSQLILTCHPFCTFFLLHHWLCKSEALVSHSYASIQYILVIFTWHIFHLLCISKQPATFHFFYLILHQMLPPSRTASAACSLFPDPLFPFFTHLWAKVPIKKCPIQGCFIDKFWASKRCNFRHDCLQSSFVCYSRQFLSLCSICYDNFILLSSYWM